MANFVDNISRQGFWSEESGNGTPCLQTGGDVNAALNRYFHDNVQLSQADAEKRRDFAFSNVERILAYVNSKDPRFGKTPVRAGSYWQGLKVDRADEFDYSIVLEGVVGPFFWGPGHPRYYGFNRPIDDNHQSLPQDLDVVRTNTPLPSPPQGYVYVPCDPSRPKARKYWLDTQDVTREGVPGQVDIVPFLVRRRLKELLTMAKRDLDLRGEIRQSRKVSGPALTMYFTVGSREVAIDFAPIIRAHLPFPSQAKWPREGVRWPSKEKIREILDFGINVVAKKDFWWMLSFAELEKKLVEKVDRDGGKRKEIHRIMKKLNGDFWCNTTKPVISSYILKNIWFWEMERYPDVSDWSNDKLWIRLQRMTEELIASIERRCLRQYFYSDINLLKSKDVRELDVAAHKMREFLSDPMRYLTKDV